ncbi:MAG TPA: FAD:protein FMN transferase [Acidimicrobiales bacterium]|nr:FAD:protein FMN transferase [Acidimicrobiales bacterium]
MPAEPAEIRFPTMGTAAHVVVVGGPDGLAEQAVRRLAELERRWSRFLPDSEVSRLNRAGGRLAVVSPDTALLVERAVEAWQRTAGAYDPTVLPALVAAGYDRDFAAVPADGPAPAGEAGPPPGCGGIVVHRPFNGVVLPAGVALDPGGIGKGLAADVVTAELVEAGAAGAMVNVGGDLRVRGEPPEGDTWSIAVEHPLHPERHLLELGLVDGAVATSSRLRRRWTRGGRALHHLIDPRTGQPVAGPLVAVTVVAADGWWAEAATKAVFVGPAGGPPPPRTHVATVAEDGTVRLDPALVPVMA